MENYFRASVLNLRVLPGRIASFLAKHRQSLATLLVCVLYVGAAQAQVSFNENEGMFKDIVCTMVKWVINLIIPAAMVCILAVGIEFFKGEEIKGVIKKMLDAVVALTATLSMIGVTSWIGTKFVASAATCNL